jgi:transcriptional regulator with XRE-family HTH domain
METQKRRGRPPREPAETDEERDALTRLALDWPRTPLADMAEEIGLSRSTLAAIRSGARRINEDALGDLVEWLRGHAKEGEKLASRLDELRQR